MRGVVAIAFTVLGALAAVTSLYGMWFHLTLGPAFGPGLELGVVALAVSGACFAAALGVGG
ncbi:MAG: hypothetical protein AB7U83_03555 [Vicinamibacterales bacterium]